MEAMAAGRAAACDTRHLEWHDFAIKQADDAVQRPHPGERRPAPAHGLRPREPAQVLWHGFGDHLVGAPTGTLDACDVVVALLGVRHDARLADRRETRSLQETLDGLLR